VSVLLKFLYQTGLNEKHQLDILEIINTIMERDMHLNETELHELLTVCLKSSDKVKKAALTTVLLAANISSCVQDELMQTFSSPLSDECCTCFIVFILFKACSRKDFFVSKPSDIELISSKLLCQHVVKVNEDSNSNDRLVCVEESSELTQIGAMAAQIIWYSVEKNVIFSSETIDQLISLVATDDNEQIHKQSKIIAAKCLYGLTKYMHFPDYLNHLLDCIHDPINEVSVYVQAAYIRQCSVEASAPLPKHLDSVHMMNISALYVMDNLEVDTVDFEIEINKYLFQTLLFEAKKGQEFDDKEVFQVFNPLIPRRAFMHG
jgi:hypothetical protein